MKHHHPFLLAIGALGVSLAISGPTKAGTIADLSTGTATYKYTANNSYGDPSLDGTAASVVTPGSADWYGGWVPNSTSSSWIAINPNLTYGNTGEYSTTFDLTGYDLSTVSITGSWTTDDSGEIDLNGHEIASLSNGNWGSLWSFTVLASSGWFNAGVNTLTVNNGGSYYTDNYLEGVNVSASVSGTSNAVPEPSSFAMLLGAVGLGVVSRRWNRRTV